MTGTLARAAVIGDLDALVSLTAAHRRRLAEWSPQWWRPSAVADEVHPLWLQHLIQSEGPVVRVIEEQDSVVACAVSMPQPGQWFIDDVAIADEERWSDLGGQVFALIPERPALTCVATRDQPRAEAAGASGLTVVTSYWIHRTAPGAFDPCRIPAGLEVPEPPRHTFGRPLDPGADGALAFGDDDGGVVVGSPPITAPPVYDPGGTVCVIDRVVGFNRSRLLRAALAGAHQRGDVLVSVVCDECDAELQQDLAAAAFQRTVDVFAWP